MTAMTVRGWGTVAGQTSLDLWPTGIRRDNPQRDARIVAHRDYALALAHGYANRSRLTQDAREEVCADAMVGLIRAIDTWDPKLGASIKTHIYRWVRSAMLDGARSRWHLKKSQKDLEGDQFLAPLSLDVLSEGGWDSDATDTGHDTVDEHLTVSATLRATLELADTILPARQRQVLHAYYFDGLRLAAIGRMFGISESTAAHDLRKALRALKDAFEQTRSG